MRKLLVAVFLVAVAGEADNAKPAEDKKEPPKKEKLLKVGDLAPELKASAWLQGEEVREFEPGKVYVVEFWATWCGPCLMIMPHTAELQAQYKDKGVTIIGYSARDPNNTEEKVGAFVKRRGPKLKYTFAYAEDRATYDAWMKAAGQNGIPCAFVVEKGGRVAYIGHPLFLGIVLPKVVTGAATVQAISDEVGKIEHEMSAVSQALTGADHKAGLHALKDFEAKYPPLANNPYWLRERFGLLLKTEEVEQAKQLAEAVVGKATEQEEPMALHMVCTFLRSQKGNKELMALAVKAAEAIIQVNGDKDAWALITLADTYFAAGDKAKAKEYARKAVEAAGGESATLKQYIDKQVRMFDADKK